MCFAKGGTIADRAAPVGFLSFSLVRELRRVPRVGEAFCGGGSMPFEVARIGCEAHGSDLNPVAALLT